MIRYQILDPLKIKYQISDPLKNQISDIMRSLKSDIWLKKIRYQILDPKKNQLSDITPPKIWFMSAEIALGHTS